jgi:hypothetical protein
VESAKIGLHPLYEDDALSLVVDAYLIGGQALSPRLIADPSKSPSCSTQKLDSEVTRLHVR